MPAPRQKITTLGQGSSSINTNPQQQIYTPNIINERGNTVGNIVSGRGTVARQGIWIYYYYPDGTNTGNKIYRVKTDGSCKQKLNDDKSCCINVVGEWIYYFNYSDNSKLYKMKTDGTSRQKISDDGGHGINLVDDWLYYSNWSDDRKLYKIKIDGTGRQKISNDFSTNINVVDGWIYYNFYNLHAGFFRNKTSCHIYKIKTDGTGRQKLNDENCGGINVVDDWLYYGTRGVIKKMKTDGTDVKIITKNGAGDLNISDGWIYYRQAKNELCRLRTDGTGNEWLDSDKCDVSGGISVIDEQIYYANWSKGIGENFYTIRTDGSNKQQQLLLLQE